MKKTIIVMLIIIMFVLSACTPAPASDTAQTPDVTAEESPMLSDEQTSATENPDTSADVTQEPDESPAASPTPAGPKMYSSYAHLVSYDPARGFADFDYFEMLIGDEAIAFLVTQGWSLAEAQAYVDDFADSEFVEKNTNPQLRTIDLREIQLKLMYYPDGTKVEGAVPINATLEDFYNLYNINPAIIKDEFFYYITVTGGEVVSVEQVYWP